jgi:competence protein ComEC
MDDDRSTRPPLPPLPAVPAVPFAAAVLAATALGRGTVHAPPGALVALALLGVAWASGRGAGGRAAGLALAVAALSILNVGVRGGSGGLGVDPARPVTAVVETTGHWRRLGEVWSAPVRVERLRQGRRVVGAALARIEPLDLNLASDAPPPPLGARLRVKGYLGRPAPLGNLPPRPPGPWHLRIKSARLVEVEAEPGAVARLAAGLRGRVEAGLRRAEALRTARAAGAPSGLGLPLARALLLGDASQMPAPVVRGLRRLGLAHVLAVSGLHVGLLAGLVLLVASPLPRAGRWGVSLAAVVFYLLLVGPRPSLLRASAMAVLVVAALFLERPPSALNALAVVAAGIVAGRPAAVADVGFQLSVGATAGLLVLGPVLSRRWARSPLLARLPVPVRDALAVSAGAQVGTLPWALPRFALVVPAAPLVNLVAVPWTMVVLPASGLWALLAVLSPATAAAVLPALDLLAAPFGWPAGVAPSPWASLPLAAGPPAAVLLALFVAAALARPRIGLPLLLAAWAWAAGVAGRLPARPGSGVEMVVVDVGQGDAILLRDGPHTLLVDGGGWPTGDLGGRVLLPALAWRGVRRLDRVLLTHGDRDHCGGLLEVASYLAVREVLTAPGAPDGPCDAALRTVPGASHRAVAAGDAIRVGRWRLRVLQAGSAPGGQRGNDASVVLVAEAFGRRVLLTGDAEAPAERRLRAAAGSGLACDVLKVAHHGSRSSSTEPFLRAAAPALALVSAGERNPYGHPAPEVLARLRRHHARILRTDRDGMIALTFHPDGGWRIELPGTPKP